MRDGGDTDEPTGALLVVALTSKLLLADREDGRLLLSLLKPLRAALELEPTDRGDGDGASSLFSPAEDPLRTAADVSSGRDDDARGGVQPARFVLVPLSLLIAEPPAESRDDVLEV